ncbi:hypothetical protein V1478_002495 [Vespula squamosa]|uniref:Uncharacterized protein n=1 Tax=Vespula squamosa TaxID=30214 RepID=A0ABD2BSS3_VESSQ
MKCLGETRRLSEVSKRRSTKERWQQQKEKQHVLSSSIEAVRITNVRMDFQSVLESFRARR